MNSRKKIYIWLGSGLFICLALIFFILYFLQGKLTQVFATINDNRSQIIEFQDRYTSLIEGDRYLRDPETTSKVKSIFINQSDVWSFLDDLEKKALENNLSITLDFEDFSGEEERGAFLLLSIDGDYLNILSYLAQLERENFYINWQEVAIKKNVPGINPEENTVQGPVNLRAKGLIYWL